MAKTKTVSVKLFGAVTAVLAVLCLFFGVMCAKTAEDSTSADAMMEKLCMQSASYAASEFESYHGKGEQMYYTAATADYNVFLCMYYTLYGDDETALADYMICNEIYTYLVTAPETAEAELHAFAHILEELAEDPTSREAMDEMAELCARMRTAAESGTSSDGDADANSGVDTDEESAA